MKLFKRYIKCVLIVFSVIILGCILANVPVFKVSSLNKKDCIAMCDENGVYVLEHKSTTGSGWYVASGRDKKLVGQNVVLYSNFDPRSLKDNKDFYLDYSSALVVKVKEISSTAADGEKIPMLIADSITVVSDKKGKNYYTVFDLSIGGLLKGALGLVNHKYRVSY